MWWTTSPAGSATTFRPHPRLEFVQGSVTDATLVRDVFARFQFQYVYHLAAYAAEGLSHFIRRFNYTNNLLGSVNLINHSVLHEVKCFVFYHLHRRVWRRPSADAGGLAPSRRIRMASPSTPSSSTSRRPARCSAWTMSSSGRTTCMANTKTLGTGTATWWAFFMNQILQGEPMTIFGDGTQTRGFTYVGDIAPVLARAPFVHGARNEVFNLGANASYTVNDLARGLAWPRPWGPRGIPWPISPPRKEVHAAYADQEKARRSLRPDIGNEP